MSYNQAMGVSALTLMQQGGLDAKMDAHRLATDAGLAAPNTVTSGAERNAGLATPEGGARDKVEGAGLGVSPEAKNVDERVNNDIAGMQQKAAGWRDDVNAGAENFRAETDAVGGEDAARQLNSMGNDMEFGLRRDLGMEGPPQIATSDPAQYFHNTSNLLFGHVKDTAIGNAIGSGAMFGGYFKLGDDKLTPTQEVTAAAREYGLSMGLTPDQATYYGALTANANQRLRQEVMEKPLNGERKSFDRMQLSSDDRAAIGRLSDTETRAIESAVSNGNPASLGRLTAINDVRAREAAARSSEGADSSGSGGSQGSPAIQVRPSPVMSTDRSR
jgi:hypothetical protein